MQRAQSLPESAGSQSSAREQVQQHLESMMSSYTTDEQRQLHRGLGTQTAAPQDVTFF